MGEVARDSVTERVVSPVFPLSHLTVTALPEGEPLYNVARQSGSRYKSGNRQFNNRRAHKQKNPSNPFL